MASVVAFGEESVDWITPELFGVMVTTSEGCIEDAIKTLVALVHCNPAAPQHMNVYMPRGLGRARCAKVHDGRQWIHNLNNNDVASRAVCAIARSLAKRAKVSAQNHAWRRDFVEFSDNLHRDYNFAQQIVALMEEHAPWVAHFHPEVVG